MFILMTRGILSTPASDVAYLVCYKLNFILYTQWKKNSLKHHKLTQFCQL